MQFFRDKEVKRSESKVNDKLNEKILACHWMLMELVNIRSSKKDVKDISFVDFFGVTENIKLKLASIEAEAAALAVSDCSSPVTTEEMIKSPTFI